MSAIQNILKMRFSQEILGGIVGVIVAVLVYHFGISLPSMQMTKGLLVDPSSGIVASAGETRVNEKNVDTEKLKRLAARANQIALQMKTQPVSSSSSSAPSIPEVVSASQAVADHIDPAGQATMRANRIKLSSVFDQSVSHTAAAAEIPASPEIAKPIEPSAPAMQMDVPPVIETPDTRLPNSGPVLNIVLVASFLLACFVRRDLLIAGFQRAN